MPAPAMEVLAEEHREAAVTRAIPLAMAKGRNPVIRGMAATDYICDPDAHGIGWHYRRKDRPYKDTVSLKVFESWSVLDGWVARRDAYWSDIETRVRAHIGDEILRRRVQDLEQLEGLKDELEKFLHPCVDEKGNVVIDEKTGLPEYPLKMPRLDQFARMWLDLHERVLLLRGEATTRSEQLKADAPAGEEDAGLNEHLRTRALAPPNFSREQVRGMARALLRQRESSLDVSGEEVSDAGGGGDVDEAV